MDTIFLNNSHLVQIEGLKNQNGAPVNGNNTVEATLLEADRQNTVAGAAWPIPLNYISGSRGSYQGDLPSGLVIEEGNTYVLRVTALVDGRQYESDRYVKVERRNE